MQWFLEQAAKHDLSVARFVVGDYGSGKTHFLRMTAKKALDGKFAYAEVTINRDIRLDRFETVWQIMMEKLQARDSSDSPEGIEGMLDAWWNKIVQDGCYPDILQRVAEIPNTNFREAIKQYLQGRAQGQDDSVRPYVLWLKGARTKPRGIGASIDRLMAREMLRSLIVLLKLMGYSGLVLFLDELELMVTQSPQIRNSSYEALRQLVDGTDNVPSFLVLCSLTEQLISDDLKGFPSYPALWQRVRGSLAFRDRDYRSLMINLNHIPLTDGEIEQLAFRIRDIYSTGYGEEAVRQVAPEYLKVIVQEACAQEEVPVPRYVVQAVVAFLEAVEQNPNIAPNDLMPDKAEIVQQIRQQDANRFTPNQPT